MYAALLGTIFLASCKGGRWERYQRGGNFNPGRPAPTFDGSKVYFSKSSTGHGDLYTFDFDTKELQLLVGGKDYEGDLALSEDEKVLLFVRERDGIGQLWKQEIPTRIETQLTSTAYYDSSASFVQNSQEIIFLRSLSTRTHKGDEIFSLDAGNLKTSQETQNDIPEFSPQIHECANYLIYSNPYLSEIIIQDRVTNEVKHRYPGGSPHWNDNRGKVCCVVGPYGREIAESNLDGSDYNIVYSSGNTLGYPTYSGNGEYIFLFDADPDNPRDTILKRLSLSDMSVSQVDQ